MPASTHYDAPVYHSKSAFMQRIADFVRQGYDAHTTGTVSVARAAALVRKFRDLYLVHLGKDMRYRRKQQKLGNAALLLYRSLAEPKGALTFVLLVSPGEHAAHQLECLQKAQKVRLEVTGYELVQQTRPGAAAAAWTWRMTSSTYQGWRDRIRDQVRARAAKHLKESWHSLHHVPGFAPVRHQVRQLRRLLKEEWKRHSSEPLQLEMMKLRYVQRLPDVTQPLSAVLKASAGRLE